MLRHCSAALLLACGAAMAQTVSQAPVASNPVVEIRGTIDKIHIERGAGPPTLDVKTDSGNRTVRLGSMRYLMEQNFNPKSGDLVVVKGYQTSGEIVAITVQLPAVKREIRLRDENGWPLWRGGGSRGARW